MQAPRRNVLQFPWNIHMADEIEVFKASVQGVTEGFTAPFAKLIDEIFGKAATQVGLALEDRAKEYRQRQRRFLERSKQMLDSSGKEPEKVPLKLLLPIVQNGSVEDDDDLQDRWAALLAKAASGDDGIPPAFPELLKQISAREARLLHGALLYVSKTFGLDHILSYDLDHFINDWSRQLGLNYSPSGSAESVRNLIRLGLFRARLVEGESNSNIRFTQLGSDFTRTCEDPRVLRTLQQSLPALDCN